MSSTIPITLQPVPVPVGVRAVDINQLIQVICHYVGASINQDVSFFLTVTADPTLKATDIIFNEAQGLFKQWSIGTGTYVAITQYQPGDIKSSFVGGDSPQQGWIVCDGRAISSIQGISQAQLSVLEQLFGLSGTLPTLTSQFTTGLPTGSAFSTIDVAAISPPSGQIGNLPFSGTYNATEEQALASNTEALRGSTGSLQASVVQIRDVSSTLLAALRGSTVNPLFTSVFVGYPA